MENVTLEPELEEALASASDAELCDIAGILNTSTHISSQQHVFNIHSSYRLNFSLIYTRLYTMVFVFLLYKAVLYLLFGKTFSTITRAPMVKAV